MNPPSKARLRGPLLVVDEYKTMREIMASFVRRLNYDPVVEAASGDEALARMRRTRFSLVICDANMKPINGVELAQAMRRESALASVPVLIVSTEEGEPDRDALSRLGAVSLLRKPFDMGQLAEALGSAGDSLALSA